MADQFGSWIVNGWSRRKFPFYPRERQHLARVAAPRSPSISSFPGMATKAMC